MTPQERSKMTKAKLRAKKAAEERAAKKNLNVYSVLIEASLILISIY